MAIQQESPEKGLIMIGVVVGGIVLLVAIVSIF